MSEDMGEQGFTLSDREVKEVEGDFCGGDQEYRGHHE